MSDTGVVDVCANSSHENCIILSEYALVGNYRLDRIKCTGVSFLVVVVI